jgi:hypothetical protein
MNLIPCNIGVDVLHGIHITHGLYFSPTNPGTFSTVLCAADREYAQ